MDQKRRNEIERMRIFRLDSPAAKRETRRIILSAIAHKKRKSLTNFRRRPIDDAKPILCIPFFFFFYRRRSAIERG